MKRTTWADVWSHTRGWLRDKLLTIADRLDRDKPKGQQ